MAGSYSFRKALNGFHREDVVRHIEYINTKHANQINQYKSDLEAQERELQQLRKLIGVQEQLEELQSYCAKLEQEKAGCENRIAQLQTQLEDEQAQRAAVVNRNEEELEAYRRAERLERQARQRAEQLCEKANGIVTEAGNKVDATAQRISQMADQVAAQLAALQQEVLGGKDALEEASQALCALQPEEI